MESQHRLNFIVYASLDRLWNAGLRIGALLGLRLFATVFLCFWNRVNHLLKYEPHETEAVPG